MKTFDAPFASRARPITSPNTLPPPVIKAFMSLALNSVLAESALILEGWEHGLPDVAVAIFQLACERVLYMKYLFEVRDADVS